MAELTLQQKIDANIWDSLADVLPVLKAASKGDWSWMNNGRCKYIELRIDMRDGGCIVRDRDGNRIDIETLKHQKFEGKGLPWRAASLATEGGV